MRTQSLPGSLSPPKREPGDEAKMVHDEVIIAFRFVGMREGEGERESRHDHLLSSMQDTL